MRSHKNYFNKDGNCLNPVAGIKFFHYISFDTKTSRSNSLSALKIGGVSIELEQIRQVELEDGWVRYQALIVTEITVGQQLKLDIKFDMQQTDVAIDNLRIATVNPDEYVIVKMGTEEYRVPVGYSNFTGVLAQDGTRVLVGSEIAGKLLASSQILTNIQQQTLSHGNIMLISPSMESRLYKFTLAQDLKLKPDLSSNG